MISAAVYSSTCAGRSFCLEISLSLLFRSFGFVYRQSSLLTKKFLLVDSWLNIHRECAADDCVRSSWFHFMLSHLSDCFTRHKQASKSHLELLSRCVSCMRSRLDEQALQKSIVNFISGNLATSLSVAVWFYDVPSDIVEWMERLKFMANNVAGLLCCCTIGTMKVFIKVKFAAKIPGICNQPKHLDSEFPRL